MVQDPVKGDTVRLRGEFKDVDGNPVEAQDVRVRIYDNNKDLVETITTGIENPELGLYTRDYTIPFEKEPPLYYEFHGLVADFPEVDRRRLDFSFSKFEGQ